MPLRVLLVDDDGAVRHSLSEALAEEGFFVDAAGSAEEALARMGKARPDVVLSDVRMPGMDGLGLLELVRERAPGVHVVLMTAYEDMPTVARAMREGAFDFLVKPMKTRDLLAVLGRAEEDREARRRAVGATGEVRAGEPLRETEGARGDEGLEALVGRHPLMIQLYKRVGKVAAGRVNVLLLGETGTGKERVARAIHLHSEAASEPFIAVNCAALPDSLLESELFGHVKGAFTGAVADRRGRFALAGRGTILLDEIGDTSPAFQGKLLRVLEEGEFFPVGGEKLERTEARVIAATHQHLDTLVEDGRFREDLFYRLRGVEIRVPPLRERVSDIPLLAQHFIRRAASAGDGPEPLLPQETLEMLLSHDWPGNVRELENCLTRAVVLTTGGVIRPEHLGLSRRGEAGRDGEGGAGREEGSPGALLPLEELERVQLERTLAATGGNRTRTAEILGISRPRLYRMLEKHGLD